MLSELSERHRRNGVKSPPPPLLIPETMSPMYSKTATHFASPYRSPPSTEKKTSNKTPKLLILLLAIFGAVLLGMIGLVWTMKSSLANAKSDKELVTIVKDLETKLSTSETERKQLSQILHQEESKTKALQQKIDNTRSSLRGNNNNEKLEAHLHDLHQRIQTFSRHAVIDQWGQGPFRLLIELEWPNKERGNMTMELAPLSQMPHTIHYLLSAVTLGLYNGTSFFRNAGHVLQAGAVPNHIHPQGFEFQHHWEHTLFQEYSHSYPHTPYTIGLAGRPAGPDWYINLKDNVNLHGPGGQGSNYQDSEADPCVGKIVEGIEWVDKMHQAPIANQGFKHMVHPVAIVGMSLLR